MRDIKGTVTLEVKEYNAIIKDLRELDAVRLFLDAAVKTIIKETIGYTIKDRGSEAVLKEECWYYNTLEHIASDYGIPMKRVKEMVIELETEMKGSE